MQRFRCTRIVWKVRTIIKITLFSHYKSFTSWANTFRPTLLQFVDLSNNRVGSISQNMHSFPQLHLLQMKPLFSDSLFFFIGEQILCSSLSKKLEPSFKFTLTKRAFFMGQSKRFPCKSIFNRDNNDTWHTYAIALLLSKWSTKKALLWNSCKLFMDHVLRFTS